MNNTAFLTTIYPVDKLYISDFFESLVKQTNNSFDIIIINDGFGSIDKIVKTYSSLNIIEVPAANSIAKNRELLIKYAIDCGYHYAIFGDIDDYFDARRVEVLKSLLKDNDIVINDLNTFSNRDMSNVNRINEVKITKKIFSTRVKNLSIIKLDFILEKNIFGLSNTAIKLTGLTSEDISFPPPLIAVDWYFFSHLLLKNKRAIFTNDTVSYYRQHDENTAGIGIINASSILKAIDVKLIHYRFMKKENNQYKYLYEQTYQLAIWLKNKDNIDKYLLINNAKLINPLWWETITLGSYSELNT